tara:strand:- start:102 stop:755 length:654 start_codon:yes stop_codon:yes gene_type:complete
MNENIETNRHKRKFLNFIYKHILNKEDIKILEFGVSERGLSTKIFLDVCEKNQGELISIDINANSKKFKTNKWTFVNTRDDNFLEIEKFIKNKKFDIIYLDTIHKADHVEKILFYYFNYLKKFGFFIIDDTSSLPYIKSREKNNFSQEINNQETFDRILEIFNENHENIDLEFSFVGTGIAKIQKLNDNILNKPKKINYRQISIKNFLRKIVLKIKK